MVKCAECGYLAARKGDTRQLEEVQRDSCGGVVEVFLQSGTSTHGYQETTRIYDAPVCFARKYNLWAEYEALQYGVHPTSPLIDPRINIVLTKTRQCNAFTKWKQGFTPKEHREMIDREWEKRWNIILLITITVLAGVFTLLNALIIRGGR